MANILTENFNAYTDGNLDTQASWTGGATSYQIQGTLTYEGAKAIKKPDGGGGTETYIGTASSAGIQGFYVQTDITTRYSLYFGVAGDAHAGYSGRFFFGGDGNIYSGHSGADTLELAGYATNTWYFCQVEWKSSGSHQVRFIINGGTPSSWYSPATDWTTNVDQIHFSVNETVGNVYIDTLQETAYVPPAPGATTSGSTVFFSHNF